MLGIGVLVGFVAVIRDVLTPGRQNRWWSGPVQIVVVIAVAHYLQIWLAERHPPRTPPLDALAGNTFGTYPSGGCVRAVADYGVMIAVLVRRFPMPRWGVAALWAVWGAGAYIEGFSRMYLSKHWLQDVLGGWALGGALLAVLLVAGAALDGPAGSPLLPFGRSADRAIRPERAYP